MLQISNFGYIYKTTNIINGKIYVGQKTGALKLSYRGSGTLIKKAINKYGASNFIVEVLCYCDNIEDLNNKEIFYIQELNAILLGYNIELGGKNNVVSDDTKKKMSLAAKGKKLSKSHIENLRLSSTGRLHSEETKQKMSLNKIGTTLSEATKLKVGLASKNRPSGKLGTKLSQESKDKISKSSKGRMTGTVHSKETKLKMSEARKLYWKNLKNK